jgi:hypothetical protein
MCKKTIFPALLVLTLGLADVQAQDLVWNRAAYWDGRYPSAWGGGGEATRDALQAAGYTILNASELKTWMDARIADRALSVVVFCRDVVPDTVAESQSATCTIRRYLDGGGKVVWYSDWPFYYQGHADGTMVTWGGGGATSVLGFNASSGPNDNNEEVLFTDTGVAWGLTQTWTSRRPTSPTITANLTALATVRNGTAAAAWAKHFLPGDNYRGFVRFYDRDGQPSAADVIRVAEYMAVKAASPNPADGSIHPDTWASLNWSPGATAVSHDVYFGENFQDVSNGTGNTFQGNQPSTFFVVGFPGFPYPDGLVPGTTYYWRIDEVEANGTTKHKGDVWSFTVPPKKAFNPSPANGAESVALDVKLSWASGFGAKLHTVYFGDDFDTVSNAVGGLPQGATTYNPGPLKRAKIYYWRVDEFDASTTHKGDVWSFATLGGIGNPQPANGAVDVKQAPVLTWTPGAYAASHEVYFGTDADAVRNATKTSPEFKAAKALGDESYAPGKLAWETTYYWRIDEVNNVNPDSPWAGTVWRFTTAGFAIVDDFEDYDATDNQIWYSWHDGLGYGTPGTPPYFAGNGTGAAVGDETTASFTEETIVHGGSQAMPLAYDNNKQGFAKYSEAELTLTDPRDWTQESVAELSIWFRGRPASVGSFVEAPAGTYTITATGADIWNLADQFHYAFKTLTGVGTIEAQVLSVGNTDPWAKAGVMIRETLDAGSKFAAVYITPGNGCRFQARATTDAAATSDTGVVTPAQIAIKAPYWVKLERDAAGNFRGYYSANGTTWTTMSWNPQNISMASNVYVGLALTSHNNAATCTAKFSNVRTTGTVGAQWAHQDIGIASNAPEPLYVAISNAAGQPAVVVHSDPGAATLTTWTEWVIPLASLADKGINLKNVDRIALGLGTRGNMTTPGGSGRMYFDDIRLRRP